MYELKFLGAIVSKDGRRPCPSKVKAIQEIPVPKGRKAKSQILTFLGMAGF